MFLLNLSAAELLAILGGLSSLVVALYLLDRSRRRQKVASLRFWRESTALEEPRRRRRRIRQPLSLALQLASIALLLLALAQPRLGPREDGALDHVLILDTSAWMEARGPRQTLMEEARGLARSWLRALPPGDRVLLVRADGLATPATGFEASRRLIEDAVNRSAPAATGLDLHQAFELARRVLALHSPRPGEIVYVGAGRIKEGDNAPGESLPANLRILPVTQRADNYGLREVGLRRSAADSELWEAYVAVHNYGAGPRAVSLSGSFGGAPVGTRRLLLASGAGQSATFELRTRAAGWLEVRLSPPDAFPADDRAVVELPAYKPFRVVAYSDSPAWLRPVLAANPNSQVEIRATAQYDPSRPADVVVLDRFRPPSEPKADSVWVDPPTEALPAAARTRVENITITRWRSDHPLAAGLRTQDLRLAEAQVFPSAPGDIAVAEVEQGPVVLARPGRPKAVFLGFHPAHPGLRYELATPLVFANILRWMSPEAFRRWELNAGSAGAVAARLESDAVDVRILSESGKRLPFTRKGPEVRFFSSQPGTVRLLSGDREVVYSLSLPEVPAALWEPPAQVHRGLPLHRAVVHSSRDLWPWLAILGALGLLADWLLFGGQPTRAPAAAPSSQPRAEPAARRAS